MPTSSNTRSPPIRPVPPAEPPVQPPTWTLMVHESSGTECTFEVGPGQPTLTVGRDADNTIRVDSPYVSRFHLRIEWHDGAATLFDLGSRNGSLLNGERVYGRAALSEGDVIAVGDATIRCRASHVRDAPTRTLLFSRALAAPSSAPPPPASRDDALYLEAGTHEVFVGGRPLARPLSVQEFDLLRYLYQHRPRVCTRQELGDTIWGRDMWDPNMLHRLVHRVKEKLEPSLVRPRYVQTVPRVGYRLAA
ncbi:MAG TPA: FHA domain-containing protein [Chloroflexota bacterium]|nr:FHA domain-containing protein [Chloroflexota bacterium]